MKLLLASVGRLKSGPERELVARYAARCVAGGRKIGFSGFDLREMDESRARRPEDRKTEEAAALAALIPPGARKICLDERGRNLNSEDFARKLGEWRDSGSPACALAIGGPDGLDPAFRDPADLDSGVRGYDLASPNCACIGGRTALSRIDHPRRPSLSSRLTVAVPASGSPEAGAPAGVSRRAGRRGRHRPVPGSMAQKPFERLTPKA